MADFHAKSLDRPDETIDMPGVTEALVELGDVTVGRLVHQPGWRWSKDVQPVVGGERCLARHVGVVLSGRLGVELADGSVRELGPGTVYDIPPGHDGWVIGDEELIAVEWSGLRAFAGFRSGARSRTLATLLFTDVVDSTAMVRELGDVAWRELLSQHFEAARRALEEYGGREVKTTGDGLLATFDGPAQALHCASALHRVADGEKIGIRAGVHVGEVELVGTDVRGVAVHECARIMSRANANETLVSEITRTLAIASGLDFEDRGITELKGLEGEWHLFAHLRGS